MSGFEGAWRAALLAALAEDAVLGPGLNRLSDGPGERAPTPLARLGEIIAGDWGAKDRPGRDLRAELMIEARGDADAATALGDRAETVIAGLSRTIDDWECGATRIDQRRRLRRRDGTIIETLGLHVRGWRAV